MHYVCMPVRRQCSSSHCISLSKLCAHFYQWKNYFQWHLRVRPKTLWMCQLKGKLDAKHLQTHNIKQMAKILHNKGIRLHALHTQYTHTHISGSYNEGDRDGGWRKKYESKIPHKRDSLTNAAQCCIHCTAHILFAQNRANSFSCSLKF